MKQKILWHSNAPFAPTGYGNQTALFAPRLNEHYDLQVSSFYGIEGAPIVWNGVPILPGLGGTYGNESIPPHARRFFGKPRDGLVVTLLDVWVLDAGMCAQYNMASWVPIDHDPAPPRVERFFRGSQAIPLAMSRFGEERLQEFDPIYVPHGVDTKVYRPKDKAEARAQVGIPEDEFVVGMVAANKGNPSRKCFVQAIEAFSALYREHGNARLYLHTDIEGTYSQGVPLMPLIAALGIPKDAVRVVDPYMIHFKPLPGDTMATIYATMDVLLNPSMGEGFGIPVLEAQACGVPVIVTDFSAMQEVCGAGWKVSGTLSWSVQEAWQMAPDTADIFSALKQCYGLQDGTRKALSEKARNHAMQYDVDRVLTEHFLPALEQVEERFAERKPQKLKVAA